MGQIEDLQTFLRIVDQGSISKAADKMGIAKSAVSRRLSLLEDRYESILIDRTPGVWDLTEIGQELYQRALRVVTEMEEIENGFRKHRCQYFWATKHLRSTRVWHYVLKRCPTGIQKKRIRKFSSQ